MKRFSSSEIRRRVEQAMRLVALTGFERRMPHQLSGGQKQRVALARALVCEPKVLLLDEPLAALDAKLRRSMQVELKRLQSRLGITFIFVTHDQEEALVMSDRIAVINRGKIEQIGTALEIYHHPRTQFVADFMGAANLLEMQVDLDEGVLARLLHPSGLQLTIPREALPEVQNVLICMRPEKIHVSPTALEGENVFEATLREEIFMGAIHQLQFQTSNGLELTAMVACPASQSQSLKVGDRLFCQVHSLDLVVLQPSQTIVAEPQDGTERTLPLPCNRGRGQG
jgi:spermidine/putrescine transport system ATP-binding protein